MYLWLHCAAGGLSLAGAGWGRSADNMPVPDLLGEYSPVALPDSCRLERC